MRLWRTTQCPWRVIRVYVFLLHFQGQDAGSRADTCLARGEAAAATCCSQQEPSSDIGLLGHDNVTSCPYYGLKLRSNDFKLVSGVQKEKFEHMYK